MIRSSPLRRRRETRRKERETRYTECRCPRRIHVDALIGAGEGDGIIGLLHGIREEM